MKTGDKSIELRLNDNEKLGEAKKAELTEMKDGRKLYKNVYPGVYLRQTEEEGSIEEEYIVRTEREVEEIERDMELEGVRPEEQEDGTIAFYNEKGKELKFTAEKPYIRELYDKREASDSVHYEIREEEGQKKLVIVIEDEGKGWMRNAGYPVVIGGVMTIGGVVEVQEVGDSDHPEFLYAGVDPVIVKPGDEMTVRAELVDVNGIEKVEADMGGIEVVELELIEGAVTDGVWEKVWTVHDTGPIDYITTITATNILGNSTESEEIFWSDWTELGGGDHGGAAWTISVATNIAGDHTNIGTFTVNNGITATLEAYNGADYGTLSVSASDAEIYGTITGSGKGNLSNNGSGVGTQGVQASGAGGAGYGGDGGNGEAGKAGGSGYGSGTAPADMGSGGG